VAVCVSASAVCLQHGLCYRQRQSLQRREPRRLPAGMSVRLSVCESVSVCGLQHLSSEDPLTGAPGDDIMSAPYHYSNHCSNICTVLQYLVRLPPFTQLFIAFQGLCLSVCLSVCLCGLYQSCSSTSSDYRRSHTLRRFLRSALVARRFTSSCLTY